MMIFEEYNVVTGHRIILLHKRNSGIAFRLGQNCKVVHDILIRNVQSDDVIAF
jgi:hypothetical protein